MVSPLTSREKGEKKHSLAPLYNSAVYYIHVVFGGITENEETSSVPI
jgi:hypothetical protein